jgi:hypothetical protein
MMPHPINRTLGTLGRLKASLADAGRWRGFDPSVALPGEVTYRSDRGGGYETLGPAALC